MNRALFLSNKIFRFLILHVRGEEKGGQRFHGKGDSIKKVNKKFWRETVLGD